MRKETDVHIDAPGRDLGKVFRLREWPAARAENWGTRALLAVVRSGVDLPENTKSAGMAGVAVMAFKSLAGVNSDEVAALLNELMLCVKIVVPNPNGGENVVRDLIEDDIEEVATRIQLKAEVFSLHTGFTFADLRPKMTSWIGPSASMNTPTSPDASAPSSHPAKHRSASSKRSTA